MVSSSGETGRTEAETAIFAFFDEQVAAGRPLVDEQDFRRFCEARPAIAGELAALYPGLKDIEPLIKLQLAAGGPGARLSELLAGASLEGGPLGPPEAPAASGQAVPGAAAPGAAAPDARAASGRATAGSLSLNIETGKGHGLQPGEFVARLGGRRGFAARFPRVEDLRQGGMGKIYSVWDENLQRPLAMKVVRPRVPEDAPSQERALGRFLEEALVTGQLDHPGIVPVHELGVDDKGRAYFTMKLVKGRTLQEILELVPQARDGWTLNRVVGVLLRVCEAVAYAHSKGVIHRDIKPANVMVGRFGETLLMDWGLARVLGARRGDEGRAEGVVQPLEPEEPGAAAAVRAPDTWLFTQAGGVVGTVGYMSPEQARGDVERVDERSDIYSLGAVLYHLLTGRVPHFEPGDVNLNFVVLMRVRRQALPPVLSLAPGAPPTLAEICERAMARDIEARYASAAEMAAALHDYLEDVSEAREEARRQATRARRINEFLIEMLASGDPAQAQGRQVTVREVLDRAAERVRGELAEQPADAALLEGAIGNLYKELGHWEQAEPHLAQARDLHARLLGPEHPDTLAAATDLALLHRNRGRLDEAEALLRETLAVQERAPGGPHVGSLRTRAALADTLHTNHASLDEAIELARTAVEGFRLALGPEDPATLEAANGLAIILKDTGRLDEAIPIMRQVVDGLERRRGRLHPATLTALSDYATLLTAAGRFDEAERLQRQVMASSSDVMGAEHPRTLTAMNNLAMLLCRTAGERAEQGDRCADAADARADDDRLVEAETLLSEALAVQRRHAGEDDSRSTSIAHNLALLLQQRGRTEEAYGLLESSIRRTVARVGEEHRITARFRYSLGRILAEQGRREEARAELMRARDTLARLFEAGHPWLQEAEAALSELGGRV